MNTLAEIMKIANSAASIRYSGQCFLSASSTNEKHQVDRRGPLTGAGRPGGSIIQRRVFDPVRKPPRGTPGHAECESDRDVFRFALLGPVFVLDDNDLFRVTPRAGASGCRMVVHSASVGQPAITLRCNARLSAAGCRRLASRRWRNHSVNSAKPEGSGGAARRRFALDSPAANGQRVGNDNP